ncbi:MAG: glutamyl-tRNA reductase [Sedimentisphaerales bacterium]|jgi:glutamyl-tRNA reductase|nr:glutamyl-tRNA reductase [Sedimentisphaerales bacterium]
MRLAVHAITHQGCPVEIRERLMLDQQQRRSLLRSCHAQRAISEACILQTCNRLEFYLVTGEQFDQRAFLQSQLQDLRNEGDLWARHARSMEGSDAARHLLMVATGLDSQLIGENQILAQVKAAYCEAVAAHTTKLILNRLFHLAFRAGKDVRANTTISRGAVSIAQAAVEVAARSMDLTKARALVIGAGENAHLVASALVKKGLAELVIANRDQERAVALCSQLGLGKAIGLEQISRQLRRADLVISSTGSSDLVITEQLAGPILAARRRPILMIDLAVPRDIDPVLGKIKTVMIKNIDDLDQHINASRSKRADQIPKAKAIVDQYLQQFQDWRNGLSAVPLVCALMETAMSTARLHASRYAKGFCQEDRQALVAFAESLAKKLLHGPISFARRIGQEPSADQIAAAELLRQIFDLHG